MRLKRWQLVLIVVCAVLLVGGLTAIMLLRDTGEFSSREVTYMVETDLRSHGYHYTPIDTKYVGDGIWELRTKIAHQENGLSSWRPVVITFNEKLGKVTRTETIRSK